MNRATASFVLRPASLVWMLLLSVAFASGTATAAPSDEAPTAQSPVSAAPADAAADAKDDRELLKPKKSRLRFRGDRPTCMCADGLTEKDIQAKQRKKDSDTQSTDP